ncbi:Nif11 family protein [Roseomonas sp. 18066]|uniref:Nif11 family protein n=1 Tax=Roseomonas sp. 18066 TaxID=2681412 RepID=UPI00135B0F80|nr:Nif11 family protein [Roseomonas sp. 18066]
MSRAEIARFAQDLAQDQGLRRALAEARPADAEAAAALMRRHGYLVEARDLLPGLPEEGPLEDSALDRLQGGGAALFHRIFGGLFPSGQAAG